MQYVQNNYIKKSQKKKIEDVDMQVSIGIPPNKEIQSKCKNTEIQNYIEKYAIIS